MNRMEMVTEIPLDPDARATPTIKSYLLQKFTIIRRNRETMAQSAKQRKQLEVIEAYRKSVDYEKKVARIKQAQKELEDASADLIRVGLSEEGNLMSVAQKDRYHNEGYFVISGGNYREVSKAIHERVSKAIALVAAVEGESDIFNEFDQLETRMMMASTVGECMVIINAIADRDVFDVSLPMLEAGEKRGVKKLGNGKKK